jgi:hypothetical protein
MTDEEQTIYLRAMIDGSAADADAALQAARGSGPTMLELHALEEEGLIELVREVVPSSTGAAEDIIVDVLGLTGNGAAFARDLPDPTRPDPTRLSEPYDRR